MLNRIKNIFNKKPSVPRFTNEEYNKDYELKKSGLEKILGEMNHLVGHATMPFQLGGSVDLYYFPNANDGTCFVTMELLEPDGTGPKPSRIGTYELVAFTKHKLSNENKKPEFEKIEQRLNRILTMVGRYSFEAEINPGDTIEIPGGKDEPNGCLIFDEYKKSNVDFMIGDRKHGLLLIIEVFKSEMEYAMQNGSQVVLDKLKQKGFYPYSDLDRESIH